MVWSDWFAVGPFSKPYNKGVMISYIMLYERKMMQAQSANE